MGCHAIYEVSSTFVCLKRVLVSSVARNLSRSVYLSFAFSTVVTWMPQLTYSRHS